MLHLALIRFHVLQHLNPVDLGRVARLNKAWRTEADVHPVWFEWAMVALDRYFLKEELVWQSIRNARVAMNYPPIGTLVPVLRRQYAACLRDRHPWKHMFQQLQSNAFYSVACAVQGDERKPIDMLRQLPNGVTTDVRLLRLGRDDEVRLHCLRQDAYVYMTSARTGLSTFTSMFGGQAVNPHATLVHCLTGTHVSLHLWAVDHCPRGTEWFERCPSCRHILYPLQRINVEGAFCGGSRCLRSN